MPPSTVQVQAKLPAPHQLHTHTRPLPHANNTRKIAEMQTQLATTYVPTLHCTASKLVSEKKTQTRKICNACKQEDCSCKTCTGKPHKSGALHARLSDKNANTNLSNSCQQEDCSKNRPRFSLLGGHITGACQFSDREQPYWFPHPNLLREQPYSSQREKQQPTRKI